MSDKTYAYLMTVIGLICGYVILHYLFFPNSIILRNALIQGFFVGFGLAVVTIEIFARIKATRINGWVTVFGTGLPGNGMFTRAAHARLFPGPINLPQEAVYWRTNLDSAGYTLSGEHAYVLHFPPGGLPPNDAFWSLTMADAKEHFVANPIHRYCVSDRSGLVPNADGSVDIYIQNAVPAGHESNWLPAPSEDFRLWLRAYIPGAAILDGKYTLPPVVEVKLKG
ncbi:MAG: DUF1214 domain-containing protein [Anaerolineaceae bacterium]|nr:DUF1214 domain-containing protein [Anaerolineaceae bacterium]